MHLKTCNRLLIMCLCMCALSVLVAAPAFAYWANSGEVNPTGFGNGTGSWGSGTSCSKTFWYCWAINEVGTKIGQTVTWNHGWTWAGRGWFQEDFWRPGYYSGSVAYSKAKSINTGGGVSDASKQTYTACNQGCDWLNLWTGTVANVANRNGVFIDTKENIDSCKTPGYSITMVGQVKGFGDRWSYLNKWVVLGPFSSTSLANANGLDEANLYFYPYIETNKGTAIVDGLFGGKKPVAHDAGDCNNANTLNFGTLWNKNPDQAAYAMAWVNAPNGAGPKFAIGSDDGCKVWLNGTVIHTNDTNRGLTRDVDVTGAKGMAKGWNRVLFKIQQGPGGGSWEGTMSLRNGGDVNQEEGSVDFQPHRYDGYSIFNEQDGWFPKMTLSNFNGVANPGSGYTMYTNNTTVTASGTVTAQFIPFWKTGYYQWGRGLSGAATYYKFTTNSAATWSHTETGVTGYRRLHFFGISKSGRTSGQASGSSGGWTYNGTGNCAWGAVFVDNVAPNNPSFSSVNVVSPTQINLAWAIPLDKGVGVGDGATEDSDSTNGGSCHYRRGDVGVNVRRGGTSVYGWGTGTSFNNTGLTPNTQYTFDIAARDNTSQSRGAWANTTSYVGTTSVYTLSPAPVANSVTPSTTTPCQGANVVWTNNLGWGAGGVEYFRYAWDKNATHTWTDTETQWSSGTLSLVPTSGGTWYLHVKGYNAANVGNGSFTYSVTATENFTVGTITGGGGSACGSIDPAEMTYSGGSGGGALTYQWYSVEGTSSPTINDTKINGATSPSYDPPAGLTATTTYNVLVTPTCGSAAFTATPVTVTVNPTPSVPTNASTNERCGAGDVDFSATPDSGCTVKWYDAATGGNVISTANPYTENLIATKTYYAASVSTEGCESATRLAVTGTINDLPAAPTNASSNTRCGSGDVAFEVTPDDGCTVKWYDAATGGNVVSTANPYTATLNSTTTYYAASVGDDCESATRTAVTGTVFAIPDAPTNASANVRCGTGDVQFSVEVESGCTVKWYDAATGGNVVSTANPYTEELTETTTLYAASVSADGCESATRTAVTGTVNEVPDAPTDPSANVLCGEGEVAFEVTPADGCTVKWYDSETGGDVVSTANPYTAEISETTTLYAVSVSVDGCESATRTAVTGTINEIPAEPTDASENSICGAGEVDFEVSVDEGCSVRWYDSETEGNVVSTANPYTAELTETTTLYAASVSADGCESETRLAVTSTVNEVPSAPADPSANAICGAGSVAFEVSVDNDCTVAWYDAATGGNLVSTANPYTTNLNVTTTLYAASVSAEGCESDTRTAVTGTVNAIPAAPVDGSMNDRCGAGEVDFEVSVCESCSVRWYDAATGGNVVSTANPYSAELTETTTLYAATVSAAGCESATRLAVTSIVNPLPEAPADPSANSVCGSGSVDFSVTVDNDCSVRWYAAASGGVPVSIANPYTKSLSETTTLYAASVSAEGCESATRTAVTGTVNEVPAAPSNASENSRCGSGEVDFEVSVDEGCSVKWYDAATGGNVISTANPYSAELTETTTLYAATVSAEGCESATRLAVTSTVNDLPDAPANPSANAICGEGSVAFEVSVDDGCSVAWYDAASGGNLVSTSNPYSAELSETTTLYAASVSAAGCESATRTAVTGTVNDIPDAPTDASENAICGAGEVDFEVSVDDGCTVKWYDAETGGNVVSTANPYTAELTETTTLYAATVSADGCESESRTAVTGTINDAPDAPTNASANVRCGAGDLDFSVTAGDDCTIAWYDAATGGNLVSTANPYTASLSETTTLYAANVSSAGCESERLAVTGTVFFDEGSILAAKQAEVGAPIELGNKTLYFKGDGFGYIEEANRIHGIRVEGAIAAGEDSIVSLIGTRGVTSEGEPCITVSQLTGADEGTIAPWGTNGKSFQFDLLDGLYVKTWGQVKWGSIDGNSYVVTTGSADTEIKVITKSAPTVSEGDFVIVTGAVGFGNVRVIYAK
ncbi:MAG: hypothetical protein ACOX3G_07285 [Armatimonadota bacterium]